MATRRKPKAYCTGTVPAEDGSCLKCYRDDVRVKKDGSLYTHYPKAPVAKTDPRHSAYVFKTYGLTGDEYEALLEHQGGKCFICQKAPRAMRLAVDHDHSSGAVRGLLCKRCNRNVLGGANDNVENLLRAVDYLNDPPAIRLFGREIRPLTTEITQIGKDE